MSQSPGHTDDGTLQNFPGLPQHRPCFSMCPQSLPELDPNPEQRLTPVPLSHREPQTIVMLPQIFFSKACPFPSFHEH